ncbi:MAG: hypothetical protein ACP5US_01165 [Candidatus Kryptoniota bacterium]
MKGKNLFFENENKKMTDPSGNMKDYRFVDLLVGILIGSTILSVLVVSFIHLIKYTSSISEHMLFSAVAGIVGGIFGLMVIGETAGYRWVAAAVVAIFAGLIDGLLIGLLVSLFPAVF